MSAETTGTTETTGRGRRRRRPRLTPEQQNERLNAVSKLLGGIGGIGSAFVTPFTGLINSAAGGNNTPTPSTTTPSNPAPNTGQEQGVGNNFSNLFGNRPAVPQVEEYLANTTPPAKKANNLPYIIGGGAFFVILLVVLIIILSKKK